MEKLIVPSILTVSDVIHLTDQVLSIAYPLAASDAKIANLCGNARQILDRMVFNQKNSIKSEFTDELNRCDKLRDRAFVSLRDILHGISIGLIEEEAGKATKLYNIIEKLGTNIYRLGYQAESAILISLFAEFDKPENNQMINELRILPYFNALKMAQAEFNSVSGNKTNEKTVHDVKSEAATDVMNEMVPALTSLVAIFQLYSTLDPRTYSEPYHKIVTVITETNTIARARRTRKQTKPGDDPKTT